MQDVPVSQPQKTRGRPRDPAIEERVFAAVAKVYGSAGWSGYNFDAVAKEAAVGKSALYSRWGDPASLLSAVFAHRWLRIEEINHGNIEQDLAAFAELVLTLFLETGGGIPMHLRRDIAIYEELAQKLLPAMSNIRSACLTILHRAQARGDLADSAQPAVITDVLTSTLEIYAARISNKAATSPSLAAGLSARSHDYVASLVSLILNGVCA